MTGAALVVIDMQVGMFRHRPTLYQADRLIDRCRTLIGAARRAAAPIFFVQHAGPKGHLLEEGSPNFALYEGLRERDPVVTKHSLDPFHNTVLEDLILDAGIRNVTICGLQTEYCVSFACHSFRARGIEVTLSTDGHSTWDGPEMPAHQAIKYHNHILNQIGITCLPVNEISFK